MIDDKHFNYWEDWFKKTYEIEEFSAFNTLWMSYFIAGGSPRRSDGRALTCQEMDADEVGIGSVHGLEDLLESVLGVLLPKGPTSDEVREPERVEGRELLDLVGLLEPVLPVVEVFVVDHAAHTLSTQE